MRVVGLTGHFICLIWQAGAVPGVLRERLEQVKLSVDPAAEVASVGDCVVPLWGLHTGFRIS